MRANKVGWLGFNGAFNAIQLYGPFKVEMYYKYSKLIRINSWSKITEKNITITVDLVYLD